MSMVLAVNFVPMYQAYFEIAAISVDGLHDSSCMNSLHVVAFAHSDSLGGDFRNLYYDRSKCCSTND